jgi:hypothetical protein
MTRPARPHDNATYLARHRAVNQRPKRCPQCPQKVQAGNLARHLRRHAREYGRTA